MPRHLSATTIALLINRSTVCTTYMSPQSITKVRVLSVLMISAACMGAPAPDAATKAEDTLDKTLSGLGFGPGVAAIYTFGDRAVDSATSDANGILRVQRKSRVRAGAIFEAHYLFGDARYRMNSTDPTFKAIIDAATKQQNATRTADSNPAIISAKSFAISNNTWGLSTAVELGDNLIRSIGFGPIFSFRRFDVKVEDAQVTLTPRALAYNISVIGFVEPNVKTLANGLIADKPLPAGTSVQFDQSHRFAVGIIFSAGF